MLRITIERQKQGLSKAALARLAGLNAATVGQIELERMRPYECQLVKIARALGLPESQAATLLEQVSAEAGAAR